MNRGWPNTKLSVLEFRGLGVQIPVRRRGYLGAFAKLRKATSSFVMPGRSSAWNSMQFDMSSIFDSLSRKFKFEF